MRTPEKLWDLIETHLEEPFNNLWDALTPEERSGVFNKLIMEYLEAMF